MADQTPGPSSAIGGDTPEATPRSRGFATILDIETGRKYTPVSKRYRALLRTGRKRANADDTPESSNKRICRVSNAANAHEHSNLVSLVGVDNEYVIVDQIASLLDGVNFDEDFDEDINQTGNGDSDIGINDNDNNGDINQSDNVSQDDDDDGDTFDQIASLLDGVNFDEDISQTENANPDIGKDDEDNNGDINQSDNVSQDDDDEENRELFVVKSIKEEFSKKFQSYQRTMKASIKEKNIRNIENIIDALHGVFETMIARAREGVNANGIMRMIVHSGHLDRPISTPFVHRDELTAELILSHIERILQSHEDFIIDETFLVEIISLNLPEKGSGRNPFFNSATEFSKNKHSVISIKNDDELCCGRALVVAKAKIDKHPQYESIRKGRKIQEVLARKLYTDAGVNLGPCGLDEIRMFQNHLTDYQIIVVSRNQLNQIIFQGPSVQDEGKKLMLYHIKESDEPLAHYDVITSMKAFLGSAYYCSKCHKGYNTRKDHKCENICNICEQKDCIPSLGTKWVYCKFCNRYFRSEQCFQNHKIPNKNGVSVCQRKMKCETCTKLHCRVDDHTCWARHCKFCDKEVAMDHLCFIQPLGKKKKKKKKNKNKNRNKNQLADDSSDDSSGGDITDSETEDNPRTKVVQVVEPEFEVTEITLDDLDRYAKNQKKNKKRVHEEDEEVEQVDALAPSTLYFFDFETTQVSGEHVPILCVVQKAKSNSAVYFKGADTTKAFCRWLLRDEMKRSTFMAHNLKGFDGHFILKYLLDNAMTPHVIYCGGKLMSMEIPKLKIKFVDSCNFLPMPLSKFPKTFDFEDMTKGWFPHYFSSLENMSYEGPLPDIKNYAVETMSTESRQKCISWVTSKRQEGYVFNFEKDLIDYCVTDVRILEEGFTSFQEKFIEVSKGIDPVDKCITIASACNLLYRTLFLKPNQIGIVPTHGYRFREQQSRDAVEWLNYVAHSKNKTIHHAKNSSKEAVVCGFRVDGFEKGSPGTVYEYHGCFWHGCPKCYNPDDVNPVNETKMWELYAQTKRKGELIRQKFNYVEMWEHDFIKVKTTDDYIAYLQNQPANHSTVTASEKAGVSFLNPRDAFFGGRTNAVRLYAKADLKAGVTIKYVDVISLYPFVNKYCEYPLGHPDVIVSGFASIDTYFGVAKCKVLPPRGLYHPVLPYRVGEKLMFPLCHTCAMNEQRECNHTDEERSLLGTWVTLELTVAMEMGYRVVEIYEVHHFPNKSDTLFREYIDKFLKIKQESSGWPEWVTSAPAEEKLEKENEYLRKYEENEGIRLDRDDIKKNQGRRSLAKLCLNSFWGKFGQRDNFSKTEYVTSPARLYELAGSKTIDLKSLHVVNDEIAEVQYAHQKDFIPEPPNTNVYIAAFTTAHARLKLYGLLKKLGESVLYFDTDSIIYLCDGKNTLPVGDYLGDLTDELEDNGGHIVEFCSAGPKNYAYVAADGTSVCKVKGFTLNYQNQQLINFDVMKDMIMGVGPDKVDVVTERKITRDKKEKKVLNKREVKRYRMVYNKRVLQDDFNTLPYGY
ncbi:uncharacterized protein LOC118416064 [Branchiostoma floridae]|uniref:DNA-directed DNA polymerase n=1 Tax=Branchiostoma floridae TaxID=7739 RepID=A0A9J7MSA2_BRAFL|nr:uncharacterized protein LOC118416064 [Branchiostoma floridae]